MDYRGAGVVVTGGGGGIGLATAAELGRRGARILITDVRQSALGPACDTLRAAGVADVEAHVCDVARETDVEALADIAFAAFGTVDILFSNAGVGISGPVTTLSRADWDWVMGVNLYGAVHGARAFLPRMVAQGRPGRILFNSSFSGLVHDGGLGPYCVSKAGVVTLAEVLRQELRGTSIGVSVVCPMRVDTDIAQSSQVRPAAERAASRAGSLTDPRDASVPGKIISPEDVATRILDAIDKDELYVLTHAEGREYFAKRAHRIDQAFQRQHPA